MDRRKVLLIVAAVIAALGTLLVFLYVRGADTRADQRYHAVQVLKAVKQINTGETVAAAQAAGKFEQGTVASEQLLPGALTDLSSINTQVALTNIYPGEQIIAGKFGATPAAVNALDVPKGKLAISVSLTDTGRVAGFVNPGADVAIFLNGDGSSRLLLPKVEVIAVGSTTVISTTTTDPTGAKTTEQLPRTLFTLAVDQPEAEKIMFATGSGELAFGLIDKDSKIVKDAGVTQANLFR